MVVAALASAISMKFYVLSNELYESDVPNRPFILFFFTFSGRLCLDLRTSKDRRRLHPQLHREALHPSRQTALNQV